MNLPFFIAKRYLFSKKTHSAINIISMVSVCGVAVATMALVCALSVLNGFQDLISSLYGQFDPQLKIYPAKGKVFDAANDTILSLKSWPEIEVFSETLEDNGLIKFQNRQEIGLIKGIDENFARLIQTDDILYTGEFILKDSVVDYAILGVGVSVKLGLNANTFQPIELFMPNRTAKVNAANPSTAFNTEYLYVSGTFSIFQQKYDDHYTLVPLDVMRNLLKYETEASSIELKLIPGTNINKVKKKIQQCIGDSYLVKNQQEQQEDAYRVVQIEKWMTFLILLFILLIATFNVIGSLSMLIIDKKDDVNTLKKLGANKLLIFKIFLFEGWMITVVGAVFGIIFGVILCFIQQYFGILRLGDGSGAFIIDAYPVKLEMLDVIIVFCTVVVLGFLTAWMPAKNAVIDEKNSDL